MLILILWQQKGNMKSLAYIQNKSKQKPTHADTKGKQNEMKGKR